VIRRLPRIVPLAGWVSDNWFPGVTMPAAIDLSYCRLCDAEFADDMWSTVEEHFEQFHQDIIVMLKLGAL
jgi:hypothetical protein